MDSFIRVKRTRTARRVEEVKRRMDLRHQRREELDVESRYCGGGGWGGC